MSQVAELLFLQGLGGLWREMHVLCFEQEVV